MAVKTYILFPNLTTHPGGPIAVGAIIADPFRPSKLLSAPSPSLETVTHTELEAEIDQGSKRSVSGGVWARFLQVANAKVSGQKDSDLHSSYKIASLETIALREAPSDEYVAIRASEPSVKAAMSVGLLGRQPVYLITGLKIAKGFQRVQQHTKTVKGGAGASIPIDSQATIGAELGGGVETDYRYSSRTQQDIIFAYELYTIADKGWRNRRTTADQYVPKGGLLRKGRKDEEEPGVDAFAATADALTEQASALGESISILEANENNETVMCCMLEE